MRRRCFENAARARAEGPQTEQMSGFRAVRPYVVPTVRAPALGERRLVCLCIKLLTANEIYSTNRYNPLLPLRHLRLRLRRDLASIELQDPCIPAVYGGRKTFPGAP